MSCTSDRRESLKKFFKLLSARHLAIAFVVLFIPLAGHAQLKPADIFSDNMVLQRDHPIHVWGRGEPGAEVKVRLGEDEASDIVNRDSTWSIRLAKRDASSDPLSMTISSGHSVIEYTNILIGDVWMCLGQSNMAFPMLREMHFQEAVTESNQPLLRFYNPTHAPRKGGRPFADTILQRLNPADFYKGRWQSSNEDSFAKMSAVGYYFGKEIVEKTSVPVGLIHMAIGGAPIEAFIDPAALARHERFSAKVAGNWLMNPNLTTPSRKVGIQNVGDGRAIHGDSLGANHHFKPGFIYACGIAKVTPLPIAGILWYQGENNSQEEDRVNEYAELMKVMVDDYRRKWQQPDLPFYFVQLSSVDTLKYPSRLWPEFRNEQRLALDIIPSSGMAVSSDHGARHNVHPRNKKVVGERLARWALRDRYGVRLIPSGPLPVSAQYKRGKVIVKFKYVGKGLQAAGKERIVGFSLDGNTEVSVFEVRKESIVIPSDYKPNFVYYGWRPFTEANLVNSEGLPASTFKVKVD